MKDLQVTSESAESPMTTDDIYDNVMGKRSGYIKGLGHLPPLAKSRFNPTLPSSTSVPLQRELTSTKEELTSTKEELTSTKEDLKTTQEELADARTKIDALKDEIKDIRSVLSKLIDLRSSASHPYSQMGFPNAMRGNS